MLKERGENQDSKAKSTGPKARQNRKTEKEEDQELLNDEENENDDSSFVFTSSPTCRLRNCAVVVLVFLCFGHSTNRDLCEPRPSQTRYQERNST